VWDAVVTGDRLASLRATLADLRREFDQGFAEPPHGKGAPAEGFLAVRVDGDAYALRTREIAGLFKDRRLVALPSAVPELLGLASFRGILVPVYDLGPMLGRRSAQASPWLVLTLDREPVGLAFEAFEGQVSARREDVAEAGPHRARFHVREAMTSLDPVRPIVEVASVVEAIRGAARSDGPRRSTDR